MTDTPSVTAPEPYIPENLDLWKMPGNYCGAEWPDHYVFLGRHRESDCLVESNFAVGLERLGGEKISDPADPDEEPVDLVVVVRESHWAVGWVEWIGIHKQAYEQLRAADKMKDALSDYPVLDEDDWTNREDEAAQQTWKNCYNPKERIKHIREHRSEFEFNGWQDMLGCVRGNYYAGYASTILH